MSYQNTQPSELPQYNASRDGSEREAKREREIENSRTYADSLWRFLPGTCKLLMRTGWKLPSLPTRLHHPPTVRLPLPVGTHHSSPSASLSSLMLTLLHSPPSLRPSLPSPHPIPNPPHPIPLTPCPSWASGQQASPGCTLDVS